MSLEKISSIAKDQLSPMEEQFIDVFQKITEKVINSPAEIEKLANSHPKGMLNYTLEDLGYVMERLCGTDNDAYVKNEILDLPLIKDYLLEDKFKDNIERCRGLYFLLIYLSNLKQVDIDGNKSHSLYVANGVNTMKDLLRKAAIESEITFFSFLRDADTEHNLDLPDVDILNPSELEKHLKETINSAVI